MASKSVQQGGMKCGKSQGKKQLTFCGDSEGEEVDYAKGIVEQVK